MALAVAPALRGQDDPARDSGEPTRLEPINAPGPPSGPSGGPGGTQPGAPPPGVPGQPGSGQPGQPGEQPGQPGGQPAQPAGPAPVVDPDNLPRRRDGLVTMSFVNADVGAVLQALAEIWGETVTPHPELTGTITVVSAKDVTIEESFAIMSSALNVRGFTMVGTLDDDRKVVEIWPKKAVVGRGGPVQVGSDAAAITAGPDVITQVVPLRYIRSKTIADALRGLVTQDASNIVSIDDTNTLVITDSAQNVKRLLEIIATLDTLPEDRRKVEVVTLKNGNASDIQQILTSLYSDPISSLQRRLQGGGGQDPQRAMQAIQMLQAGLIDPSDQVKITADTRTNSLVIYATPEVVEQLKTVIAGLDKDVTQQVVFRSFPLQYAQTEAVVEQLQDVFPQPEGISSGGGLPSFFRRFGGFGRDQGRPGFTSLRENLVVADVRTNSVLVTATPENMLVYEDLIRSLDKPSELQDVLEVVQLEFGDATQIQRTLQQLLRGGGGGGGFFFFLFGGGSRNQDTPLEQLRDVTVVADGQTNSLILSGPNSTLPTVRRMIDALDQPQAQVYISVIIADVTLRDDQQLGVEMSWLKAPGTDDTAETQFNLDSTITQGIRYALVDSEFQALLRALSDRNKVKVLSTPHITTLDNVEAEISIGQQFPFVSSATEQTGGNFRTTTDFKDIVIRLQVTPRVSLGSQMVVLDVNQTIDELVDTLEQGGFEQPLIATRTADTQVMVQSGQTIVIGGIIRDRLAESRVGVPILQDLPIIGGLFRRTRKETERTELMVFMTPFVVTDDEQLDAIRRMRQDQLRENLPQVEQYLRLDQQIGSETPEEPGPAPEEPGPMPPEEPTPRSDTGPQAAAPRVPVARSRGQQAGPSPPA